MLERVIDWLKLPTKAVAAACLAASFFLSLSEGSLRFLGLITVAATIRPYAAGVAILSASILVIEAVAVGYSAFTARLVMRQAQEAIIARLNGLNAQERALLAHLVDPNQSPYRTHISVMEALVLERDQIITRVLKEPNDLGSLWWTLDPRARAYLDGHPGYLPPAPPGSPLRLPSSPPTPPASS